MTFLTIRFRLTKTLTPRELERLGRLSTVYGIRGLAIQGNDLKVDYDASRIHEAEALAQVRRAAISVQPHREITPGSFDHTGEFKDFAWPTSGISPVNQQTK